MDEVELISLATNYLFNLGFFVDNSAIIDVDKTTNKVSFKNVINSDFNDYYSNNDNRSKNLKILNIDFNYNDNQIYIVVNSSSFFYKKSSDFYLTDNSRLSENRVNFYISFIHNNDYVIMTDSINISTFFNGHIINEINDDDIGNDIKKFSVDSNYKLSDGFPSDKIMKKVKE